MPQKKKDSKEDEKKFRLVEVTQEMFDANPDMAEQGIEVGDEIEVPEGEEGPKPGAKPAAKPAAKERTKPVQVHNTSPNRSINHVFKGKAYTIGAGRVAELPPDAAEAIMTEWPQARLAVEEKEGEPVRPWEENMPNAYAAAKAEHGAKGFQVKDTVGPDRPKVYDPPVPKDEEGKPDTAANKFICPTCLLEFTSHTAKCAHMKAEHGI